MTTDRGAAPVASDPEVLLRAGALLPADAPVRAERISARRYGTRRWASGASSVWSRSPSARPRTWRCRRSTSARAAAPRRSRSAGRGGWASRRRRSWPIPRTPAFALGVVKEMERYARMAKAKPGNAKDGFERIATRLAASVPALPPVVPRAGGARVPGGQARRRRRRPFGRAREAERAYGCRR